MDIKLTNGKKIIIRSKEQYDANPLHFKMRGYAPVGQESTEIKKNNDKLNEFYTESVDSLVDDDYQTGEIGYKPQPVKREEPIGESFTSKTYLDEGI